MALEEFTGYLNRISKVLLVFHPRGSSVPCVAVSVSTFIATFPPPASPPSQAIHIGRFLTKIIARCRRAVPSRDQTRPGAAGAAKPATFTLLSAAARPYGLVGRPSCPCPCPARQTNHPSVRQCVVVLFFSRPDFEQFAVVRCGALGRMDGGILRQSSSSSSHLFLYAGGSIYRWRYRGLMSSHPRRHGHGPHGRAAGSCCLVTCELYSEPVRLSKV